MSMTSPSSFFIFNIINKKKGNHRTFLQTFVQTNSFVTFSSLCIKEELEDLKKELHCSSLPDVIVRLIQDKNRNAEIRKEEQKKTQAERER